MKPLVILCIGLTMFGGAVAAQPPKVDQPALKSALSDLLKDADSAKFKDINLKLSGDGALWLICGQVNSKNSYGAFSGFSRFFIVAVPGAKGKPLTTFAAATVGEVADLRCAQENLDRPPV